jgi:predicted dehydrogenase
MVGHNQRFLPAHQRVKALLDEGVLGTIYCARADHNQDFRPPAGHWIRVRAAAGGGAVIGYGVHRIDLLRWYVGEVVEVAHFQVFNPQRFEGETSSVTSLKFASGAIGEMTINWTVRSSPWMDLLYLYGDAGSLHNLGGLYVDSDRGVGAGVGFAQVDVPAGDAFVEQIRHFARSVLDDKAPLTSGPDARKTLEVCLAAYRSAETGQIVRLPLV